MFPWPPPFNSRGLITKETVSRAVKARVQIVTCLGLRIHVAWTWLELGLIHVAMMIWNRFPLWWRRPEAKPAGFGGRMKEHWGHPLVLLLEDGGLPGGWLWRSDDGLWRFLRLWLDGREVVGDEGAVTNERTVLALLTNQRTVLPVGDIGRVALLILVNTMLLCRKFLFLNFTGEYSSKFSEGSLENWAFLMRPKKMHEIFFSKKCGLFHKIWLYLCFFLGENRFWPIPESDWRFSPAASGGCQASPGGLRRGQGSSGAACTGDNGQLTWEPPGTGAFWHLMMGSARSRSLSEHFLENLF